MMPKYIFFSIFQLLTHWVERGKKQTGQCYPLRNIIYLCHIQHTIMFSKSCEYGLRAVMFIAKQSDQGEKVGLAIISQEINSPEAFTAKILRQLTKSEILKSIKGPYGGVIIENEKLKNVRLSDVVNVFDGDSIYKGCGLGLKECNADLPCPIHHKFVEIRNNLKNIGQEYIII